jgi:hypothetical protein
VGVSLSLSHTHTHTLSGYNARELRPGLFYFSAASVFLVQGPDVHEESFEVFPTQKMMFSFQLVFCKLCYALTTKSISLLCKDI